MTPDLDAIRAHAESARLGGNMMLVWPDDMVALCAAVEAAQREAGLAKRIVNRLPLCPDHRDKFDPDACQACRAERLEAEATRLRAEVERLTIALDLKERA
jgi:hypothetical protein